MKIDAIRLAAFRRFSEPVAVEGLEPGMNVLEGSNEMGKSTVFRALEAAFLKRHKVTGANLEDMRPLSGGEPLVEVDFTVAGTPMRIRKQFGRRSTAILTNLAVNSIVARNDEAEKELVRLIGRNESVEGPIGLVWVRQQRTLLKPDPDFDPQTGKPKGRSERDALNAVVESEIEAAASGEAFQRIQARTAKALDHLLTPTRNAPRKNGPLDLARRERDAAEAELERAERAAAAAEQRIQEIERAAGELSKLKAPEIAAHRTQERSRLQERVREEEARRGKRNLLREALRARELERESAERAVAAAEERIARLAKLKEQSATAHALQSDIARLSKELNEDAATPQTVERLIATVHARDLARAECDHDPAIVEIALEPGGRGKIAVDGKPLEADARREVRGEMRISVPGVGKIRVKAPGAERIAAAQTRAEAAEAEIMALCAKLGVTTPDEARERAATRAEKGRDLDRNRARLAGMAPKGIEGLDAEVAELSVGLASVERDSLQEAAKSTAAAEHVARANFNELNQALLSDQAFGELTAMLEAASAAEATAAREIQRLESRIDNLKSEQAGADEDGLAGEVDALRGTLERHEQEVKRLEAEGKALLLLARTLTEIETKARDRVFAPVTRRLKPYLEDVFGAADVAFKDAFAVAGLIRGGERHDFAALSDGTQEQLSVLVRVAYAELLSEQGEGVPLVLDDPLVYSDDARLERLCGVLERAAAKLQIVLLTCRPLAFQKLSGRRVSLTAWQPEILNT